MQIVIDIPNGAYEELCNAQFPVQDAYRIVAWIKNGTPLPKGHGRLIDADELDFEEVDFYSPDSCYEVYRIINDAPTIIEADKEVEV